MSIRTARKSSKINKRRKQKLSWKKSKAVNRFKRKLRILFFAVFSVVLTVLLLGSYSIYRFIKAPLISASLNSLPKEGEWKGDDELAALVFVVDDKGKTNPNLEELYLLYLSPVNNKYSTCKLPIDAEVEMAERYGEGSLRRAFLSGGVLLVQETVFKDLAVNAKSYVLVDENGVKKLHKVLGDTDFGNLSNLSPTKVYLNWGVLEYLRSEVRTNLSAIEILRAVSFVMGTSKSENYELGDETVQNLDYFDSFYRDKLLSLDKKVSDEGYRVMVLNGAQVEGLAFWGGRVVQNGGVILLDVGNADKTYDRSFILAKDTGSRTVLILSKMFGISSVEEVGSGEYSSSAFRRGDAVVVLGLDIAKIF